VKRLCGGQNTSLAQLCSNVCVVFVCFVIDEIHLCGIPNGTRFPVVEHLITGVMFDTLFFFFALIISHTPWIHMCVCVCVLFVQ
jgi:hypothetical protein